MNKKELDCVWMKLIRQNTFEWSIFRDDKRLLEGSFEDLEEKLRCYALDLVYVFLLNVNLLIDLIINTMQLSIV